MENLTHREFHRFSEFLRDLYAVRDKQRFVLHAITSLHLLVPSEVTSYNDIDAETEAASYKVWPTDFTMRPDSAEVIGRFAYQIPALSYFIRTQKVAVKKNTDFLTLNEFRRTDIFNEFYAPHRIPYTIGFPLAISQSRIIVLAQHRDRKDFSERDRSILEAVRPHLLQAYANAQIVSRMKQETVARDCALDHLNMGIVGVTAKGKIQWVTQIGRQFMRRYFPPRPRKNGYLPETLMDWMRRNETLSSDPTHIAVPHPMLTIQHGERSLRIRFVPEDSGGLLFLEECCERFPHEEVLALGLTPREAEVLSWLVQGKTSIEIGKILGASPRTIHKHVERIFDKLGVENRVAAVAIVHELRRTTF